MENQDSKETQKSQLESKSFGFDASLLSAVILAALMRCTTAAPTEDAPAGGPAGEPSGDEEEYERPSDPLMASLESVIGATERHRKEFEDEFHTEVKYDLLENYKIPSVPANCPKFNFSKETCLHRLAQGLLTYSVLLRHVEREYPHSFILSETRHYSSILVRLIKQKMKNPAQVTPLSSSQEQQLLGNINHNDSFHSKITAHSILYKLHFFLVDCKRAIRKMDRPRRNMADRVTSPVVLFHQKLK
ncbi:uncharacterized protein V6R79_021664 [Siganus canaliculatus]